MYETLQVHNEVKYLVNVTLVERYHVDAAARNAIDRMQMSVSCSAVLSAACSTSELV